MKFSFLQLITGSVLRNKFIFFFILLASIPVLVLGGVALHLIDLSHRRDVSALELQLLDQKIEEIGKFFSDTLGILEVRVGFTQKSPLGLAGQQFLLEGLLEENSAFQEVSFIDIDGLIANDVPTMGGAETTKTARYNIDPNLLDVSRLEKYRVASKGKTYIGDVYYTLSGPAITLASPVYNRGGDIIQILSAEVNLSEITRSIRHARLGTSGYLVLVDNSGSLIAYRGQKDVLPGTDLAQHERVIRILRGETLDGLGERDRYRSFFGAAPVAGAGKKIPKIEWAILAEWPLEDADAVIRDIRNQVALLVLFSILTVLVLAPFFAGRLVGPIRRLEKRAKEIEKGDFERKVAIKTGDELEELGVAFNKMAKGLKRLKELRDEFVFIAAHELRSPTTVIKGYISMILEGKDKAISKDTREYLMNMDRANQRLLQLVEDLLEVARSEAGRIAIEVKSMDIAEAVSTAIMEVKPLADEKAIILNYRDEPNIPKALANIDRVKEIMVNLVGNAIKYTPNEGVVQIYHEVRGKELVTHIKDNGFGIAKEGQKKIFQKFYRIQTTKTRNIAGTGLGLFIVKTMVEKMKGRIWFESEEGSGSTFSFSLPLA